LVAVNPGKVVGAAGDEAGVGEGVDRVPVEIRGLDEVLGAGMFSGVGTGVAGVEVI
jgi:hypothetical protein